MEEFYITGGVMPWTVKLMKEYLSRPGVDENDEILIDIGYPPIEEHIDKRTRGRNVHEPMGYDAESFDGVFLIEL